jgi:hypothetical protein
MSDSPSPGAAEFCTKCGAQLKPDASFCTVCGAPAVAARPAGAVSTTGEPKPAKSQPRGGSSRLWLIIGAAVLIIGLLAVLLLNREEPATALPPASQPQAAAQQAIPYSDVPRISPTDAKAQQDTGQAVVVDVRDAESYQAAHVKGAISIPLDSLEARMQELPKNAEIITYCT